MLVVIIVVKKKLFQQVDVGINQHKLIFRKATELMKSLVQSPVPVIAKVLEKCLFCSNMKLYRILINNLLTHSYLHYIGFLPVKNDR